MYSVLVLCVLLRSRNTNAVILGIAMYEVTDVLCGVLVYVEGFKLYDHMRTSECKFNYHRRNRDMCLFIYL